MSSTVSVPQLSRPPRLFVAIGSLGSLLPVVDVGLVLIVDVAAVAYILVSFPAGLWTLAVSLAALVGPPSLLAVVAPLRPRLPTALSAGLLLLSPLLTASSLSSVLAPTVVLFLALLTVPFVLASLVVVVTPLTLLPLTALLSSTRATVSKTVLSFPVRFPLVTSLA